MSIKEKKRSSELQISTRSLRELGLPLPHAVTPSRPLAKGYGMLGQCIERLLSDRQLSSYQDKKVGAAISSVREIFSEEDSFQNWEGAPDKVWAQECLSWLKVVTSGPEIPASRREKLEFLYALIRQADSDALSKVSVEGRQTIPLQALRQTAVEAPLDCDSAVLAFVMPGKKPVVLMSIGLVTSGDEGLLMPHKNGNLLFNTSALLDESGEPRGDFEADNLAQMARKDWSEKALADWTRFVAEIDERMVDLCGGRLEEVAAKLLGRYRQTIEAWVVDESLLEASLFGKVYKSLLDNSLRHTSALGDALDGVTDTTAVTLTDSQRSAFLGHMDTCDANGRIAPHPLDPSQRLAAMQAGDVQDVPGRSVLAINGPPGTGKTSFLRAVLASRWVSAARTGEAYPDLVLGVGATNKAVSNMIEAFSDVPGRDGTGITGRWIDGLPSYGWFLPSTSAAEIYPEYMQLRYDKEAGGSCSPVGSSVEAFIETPVEEQLETYLDRARAALKFKADDDLSTVIESLRCRISSKYDDMVAEQQTFARALDALPPAWSAAHASCGPGHRAKQERARLEADIRALGRRWVVLDTAIAEGKAYRREAKAILSGWRRWLPEFIRQRWFGQRLDDLPSLSAQAEAAWADAGYEWSNALVTIDSRLREIEGEKQKSVELGRTNDERLRVCVSECDKQKGLRRERRAAHEAIRDQIDLPLTGLPGESSVVRLCRLLSSSYDPQQSAACDQLWARFDAGQDLRYRVEMFHFAARYWEGRWLQMTLKNTPAQDDHEKLQRVMMLGVIVVGTSHMICLLKPEVQADLMIMDEAGQCAPEVAIATLALAKAAIFVGDDKQLQPISSWSEEAVERVAIARNVDTELLPVALQPGTGSGIALAQRACAVSDGHRARGVSLMYHYRCHPTIAQYCNALLYTNSMTIVRPDKPTPAGLPPMSWVAVNGDAPVKHGSSWVNEAEIDSIVDWLSHQHGTLVEAYERPLEEIVAIVAPLRGQADRIRDRIIGELGEVIGAQAAREMVVGTVHKLQGAQRPIVLFSLVQQRNPGKTLFADADGGFMMNVAVSRAQDAFIVFAERDTLRPAPGDKKAARKDAAGPIKKLGAYLREHGQRLQPRVLVIIEATGKKSQIQSVLGPGVEVIDTQGTLQNSILAADGSLAWTDPPAVFVESLTPHAGLLDELVIATDDDIAGELIGMHAAELGTEHLGGAVAVSRMRFRSLDTGELRAAWSSRGRQFDTRMLAAALTREYARHLDQRRFRTRIKDGAYFSDVQRSLVACVDDLGNTGEYAVYATLENGERSYEGFVVPDNSTLTAPKAMTRSDADAVVAELATGAKALRTGRGGVTQIPGLYPASTTARILALASEELDMLPWDAQAHLNALYQGK